MKKIFGSSKINALSLHPHSGNEPDALQKVLGNSSDSIGKRHENRMVILSADAEKMFE